MLDTNVSLLNGHLRFSRTLAQRLSVLIVLLAAALLTTSCGLLTQPAGAQGTNNLKLPATIPAGTADQAYNAVLAVGGGTSPYHFSVSSGALPPGVSLNPTTGTLSGTPTTAGTYSFEVMVTDSPLPDQGSQTFNMGIGKGGSKVQVALTPTSVTLLSNQNQQFTATVSGTSNTAVTWSAAAGSVDGSGLYTAPAVTTQTNAIVTATSNADTSKSASATVTVNPLSTQPLAITTTTVPQGQQGNPYSEVFAATGGTTPYSWSVSAGTPPAGIIMNANGDFAGTPTAAGTYAFTVTVTDGKSKTANGNFSTTVLAGGNFDGPAELPRVTVPSAMSDTPAPGSVITVNAGGNLQTALDNAHCGDVIELQAGATFAGRFTLPAKNCDSGHWIIVRTSAPDSALPAEGQRATPCYAGVASLPGRPQYSCPNPSNVMAKVQMLQATGDGPFFLDSGANYYRFVGLEITRPAGIWGSGHLIMLSGNFGGIVDHFVVDRSWLHGNPHDETRSGVDLNGMGYVAVVDSYFNDFHCIAGTGTCTDAHAIGGGVGDTQDGPFKIQNNFLEASGEAILFGGGRGTSSPTDIEVVNNHFFKPWQWMPGNPNFIGGPDGHPFIVKNHFELKNAVRVLFEANLMENVWGGFSQTGYAILLTPRNQPAKNGTFLCPVCQVTDVTIRYVHISHGAGGIQMATVRDTHNGPGQPALAGTRWSIHDVVIDDLSTQYKGGGVIFEMINGWLTNPINTVTINHVTAFPDPSSHMMITGNRYTNAPMYGLVFTNNVVVVAGPTPVLDAEGGTNNCAQTDVPVTTINNCFITNTFSNNALVATSTRNPPSKWPANNLFPATIGDAGFVNFNNGNGGNYELQSSSPYKNKGTDGKDLGADIVGLNAALANVE
jgi:Putative Ig domain